MEPGRPEHVSERLIYDGWAKVYLDTLRHKRTGKEYDFVSISVDPGVAALAITEKDEVVLVEQYRNAIRRTQLELPGGGLQPTETVPQGANRELREETGYTAAKLDGLGMVYPAGGVIRLPLHLVLARDLTKGEQKLDELEDVVVRLVPYEQLRQELRENKHTDMTLYAALALYELKKQQP